MVNYESLICYRPYDAKRNRIYDCNAIDRCLFDEAFFYLCDGTFIVMHLIIDVGWKFILCSLPISLAYYIGLENILELYVCSVCFVERLLYTFMVYGFPSAVATYSVGLWFSIKVTNRMDKMYS